MLAALGHDERTRLAPHFERVELKRGQELAGYRAPIRHAYFPVDAVTSTLMELPDGESVEVGLMGTEGVTGLSLLYGERDSNTTVVAQVPGSADRIAADVFAREVVACGGPFYRLLLRYANAFMEMMAQAGACNGSHTVEQRFARWLLLTHDRVGTDYVPLTQEYFALMLGVRRASVSGAAQFLRMNGAIEYHRGHVQVRDRSKLLEATCGCYFAMVETMERLNLPAA
ncbi:MAG TPA: Crp/Fnr family transcriptional regulator [Candidatus Elarobacter sp.]